MQPSYEGQGADTRPTVSHVIACGRALEAHRSSPGTRPGGVRCPDQTPRESPYQALYGVKSSVGFLLSVPSCIGDDGMRVTVVGSGFVGATAAMRIAQKGLADDVVMIDIIEGLPQGLALDMRESAPIENFEPNIRGTNDYADTAGSDVVVITAGLPRQPGMSRMDLLDKNAGIIRGVVEDVATHSPNAILIVVTNPLDEMTFLASEVSGFPKERVMGMAGVLDSSRLRYFIAEELGISPTQVEAITLGSHGESMVPLPRQATAGGKPLTELVDEQTLERLYQRTRDAGAEIVELELNEEEFSALRQAAEGIRAKCEDLAKLG